MSAEYTRKLQVEKDMSKVQEAWRERLKTFVGDYPSADDAPDALLQLGMVSEFMGKEPEARNWYAKLAKEYTANVLSKKGQGCLDRLDLEGKVLELSGPKLGTQAAFDIGQLSGKVVIVYYWASWNGQCAGDFAKLKTLLTMNKSKGLDLVCVNLDNNQNDAIAFLQQNQIEAVNLFQAGALESPLAVKYGILVLPNMFLVGKDGKVVSRSVQMGSIEDEVKKLMNDK
jgi:thiol-disulfide isomerase/thioredoxin